jgi:chromosome segregation ATPase
MNFNKETATIIVEVVGVIVSAIIAPIVGWLVKAGLDSSNRLTTLELSTRTYREEFDVFKTQHQENPIRLTKVEDAIVGIHAAMERSDKRFETIMERLDQLPRLAALLDNYQQLFQMMVPRNEVDNRVRSIEDRLKQVESDVRDRR